MPKSSMAKYFYDIQVFQNFTYLHNLRFQSNSIQKNWRQLIENEQLNT